MAQHKEFGMVTMSVETVNPCTGVKIDKPEVKISWPSLGMVSIEQAKKFQSDIAEAIKAAEAV